MKQINFIKQSFPKTENGTFKLPFTEKALLRAVVAAGRKPWGGKKAADVQAAINAYLYGLKSAVDMAGPELVPTPEYLACGATERAQKSFLVGNALCAHAAYLHLNIPWLMNYERLNPKYTVETTSSKQRPDYLGMDVDKRFFVFESKGRNRPPSSKVLKTWKKQTKVIKQINGEKVWRGIVSAASICSNVWGLTWADPTPEADGADIVIDEMDFFDAYYQHIVEFIETDAPAIETAFGIVKLCRDADVYVGLHRLVATALRERDSASIYLFATELNFAKEANIAENRTGDDSVFRDGLIIKLGPAWIPGGTFALTNSLDLRRTTNSQSRKSLSMKLGHVGEIEKQTQKRLIQLFHDRLGYDYLGNWEERAGNSNVEEGLLRAWLSTKHDESTIKKVLFELGRAKALGGTKNLYDANREVYGLLRYGVKVKPDVGDQPITVRLIDWENPTKNDFAIAEEVTVAGVHNKRPDLVLYVNGVAVAILELKRSIVSVAEGIRQNIDSQKKEFIQPFFGTVQLLMAGNDTEGLRYGAIETKEKYYLNWKELSDIENPLNRAVTQLCRKERLLELIHDFTVFDAGIKKTCRHNQYFGVRAAQEQVQQREGGIIWHTQGSGKSLTMVWLAKWIREHVPNSRVLLITDRTELDEQIESVFLGVNEKIRRTKSGADLIDLLNKNEDWLMCSLVHKFGASEDPDIKTYLKDLKEHLPPGFHAKGDIFVFVDECHRTHSGDLHEAMKAILPGAMFIGFTGTPLLKKDKQKSIEVFGPYIHTYKYDEAVRDEVVLDLRYEARDIDQYITAPEKIDKWFELKTAGLTDTAKAELKRRWGTMQKVLSSEPRLKVIVDDVLLDMETRDRLKSGHGNAMLVTSIYSACRVYEMFSKTDLAGKCAIVTSYQPSHADIKGEDAGEGKNEKLLKYEIYRKMLAAHFNEPEDSAVNKVEQFEKDVKRRFIKEPGQMKLLIVVDKLLTGFDAPPATYLYIDKKMENHGLFQAICRVNRLDTEDKEYGYIIDYKDLFKSLERSINDYTGEAFEGYDAEDVKGLLTDRLSKAKERLEDLLESVRAQCEPVEAPRDSLAYQHYFCAKNSGSGCELEDNEHKRVELYKTVAALVRAYADLANEMTGAGYTAEQAAEIKGEVQHYEKVREEIKLASGDYVDMKMYEPAMRHLLDTYIKADESKKLSAFDDLTLVQLIVEKGEGAVKLMPEGLQQNPDAMAEAIENNVRRLIIDEMPVNPKYFEKMSELLEALIKERKEQALHYTSYLQKIAELAKKVQKPESTTSYPSSIKTGPLRALYDNLGQNEELAVRLDLEIRKVKQADWRGSLFKERMVRGAIRSVLGADEALVERVFGIVEQQREY